MNNPLILTDPTGHYGMSDWWSDTRAGAGIVAGWYSSAKGATLNTLAKPFVTAPIQWDPNSYNALNSGALGQPIPGVGNAATAPLKAGAKALMQAATFATPGLGEERAFGLAVKEGVSTPKTTEKVGLMAAEGAGVAPRALTSADLGIEGTVFQLKGSFSVKNEIARGSEHGRDLFVVMRFIDRVIADVRRESNT